MGAFEHLHRRGVGFGQHDVVRVGKGDIFAAGVGHTGISGCSQTAVGLVDDSHARVARGPCLADSTAAIGASVIDEDDLDVAQRLAEHRVDGLVKVSGGVVHRHDHREQRVLFHVGKAVSPTGGRGWHSADGPLLR